MMCFAATVGMHAMMCPASHPLGVGLLQQFLLVGYQPAHFFLLLLERQGQIQLEQEVLWFVVVFSSLESSFCRFRALKKSSNFCANEFFLTIVISVPQRVVAESTKLIIAFTLQPSVAFCSGHEGSQRQRPSTMLEMPWMARAENRGQVRFIHSNLCSAAIFCNIWSLVS